MAAVLSATTCSTKKGGGEADKVISTEQNMPGDSTVYGLACDGCNDTILVFLPRTGGDPDTFNILGASKQHQVFGRMSGKAVLDDGTVVEVKDMMCFAEKVHNRY